MGKKKIDVNQSLKDLEGKPLGSAKECVVVDQNNNFMKDAKGGGLIVTILTPDDTVTLKKIMIQSLLQGEENQAGSQKADDYVLLTRLSMTKEKEKIELDNKEIERVKK